MLVSVIADTLERIMTENRDEIVVRRRKVELDIIELVEPMRVTIATGVADGRFDVPEAMVSGSDTLAGACQPPRCAHWT